MVAGPHTDDLDATGAHAPALTTGPAPDRAARAAGPRGEPGARGGADGRALRVGALALLAIVVAAIHVYPDLWFVRDLGAAYRGVHLMGAAEETTYLSRISRVLAGDYRLGNAMILEHRADPSAYGPLAEYVQGTVGRVLGLSIARLDIAATAVLPVCVFLLSVLMVRALTGRFWLSVGGALVLTLGQFLVAKNSPLLQGRLFDPDFINSLQFVRPVAPQFQYPLFFLTLWLLFRGWAGRQGVRDAVLAGLAVGLDFYVSVFFWTFLMSAIALFGGWGLITRDARRWRTALVIGATALLVGIPYFASVARTLATPGLLEASLRAGVLFTHRPFLPPVHVAWLLAFAAWFSWRPRGAAAQFTFVLLLAGLACLNQQVVTGRTVQPFHWETYTNKVSLLLSFCVLAADGLAVLERAAERFRLRAVLTGVGVSTGLVITALLIAHGVLLQANYYRVHRARFADVQEIGPVLEWLRRAAPRDAVVLADPATPLLSELVAVYGQRFTYLSETFFAVSLLPQREIDDRYLIAMRVFGFDEQGLQRVLGYRNGFLFLGIQVRPEYHLGDDRAIRRHLEEVAARYRRIVAGLEPLPSPLPFGLDYMLATSAQLPAIRQDVVGSARPVFSNGRFHLLELQRPRPRHAGPGELPTSREPRR